MTDRCLHCGRGRDNTCQPCLNGNPPTPLDSGDYRDEWEPDQNKVKDQLAAIPDLYANLPAIDFMRASGMRSANKPGSRPLIRLDIRALTDSRLKDGWLNLEPADIDHRLGVHQALWTWVFLLDSELEAENQCPDDETLTGLTGWLSHNLWFLLHAHPCTCPRHRIRDCGSFAASIQRMYTALISARDEPADPKFVCPDCGARMFLEAGQQWLVCDEGHSFSVRDLEQQQRRRPALSTDTITTEFAITRERLYQWHRRGKIKPAHVEGKRGLWWFPWDVLCLLNPALASAIDTRDTLVR